MNNINNFFKRFWLDRAFIYKSTFQCVGCVYTICGFLSVWFSFCDCLPNDWSFWNKFFLAISVLLWISVICCIVVAWIMLKPRLHEGLNASANVVLFLSSNTRYSRALREEIDYAINTKGLPIIVVYPELSTKADIHTPSGLTSKVKNLWDKLPVFRDNKYRVSVLHIPYNKALIRKSLDDSDLRVANKTTADDYFYI